MFLVLEENFFHIYRLKCKKCASLCAICCVSLCFVVLVILLAIFSVDLTQKVHVVFLDGIKPKFVTDAKFLSIALDSSNIASSFKHFNMRNPKIIKMMSALSPGYLRVGGTMADRLTFTASKANHFKHLNDDFDGGVCAYEGRQCDYLQKPNFTMNTVEWLELNLLAKSTGLDLIFDLNLLKRFDNGSWDYENAEKLIRLSNNLKLDVNWELGNEPNAFRKQFNYEVTPSQVAKDFRTLKSILKKFPKYAESLLLGPDVTRPEVDNNASQIYLREFLAGAGDVIDAVTWHQYYFRGATARVVDFLNSHSFDILEYQIRAAVSIVREQNVLKPVWLGETSSAYGGGAPHLSNRYIASFLWLDKLGMAAKNGLSVVIRQSIFKGHYALINNRYDPTPDWWVSVLYKRLVGNEVVDCYYLHSEKLRLYCHCAKRDKYGKSPRAVTVFGVNISNRKQKIRFEGISELDDQTPLTAYAYILTTVDRIDSRFIFLNDQLLQLTITNDVPDLLPWVVNASPYVEMPAYSLAFWVLPITNDALPFC